MKSDSTTLRCVRVLAWGILVFCFLNIITIQKSHAAPAPGSMGGGTTCPPACPPNAANCDANLVLTPTQALQFGSIAAPAAGTVTVDTAGVRTSTGGVVLIPSGIVTAANFSMTTTPYNCTGRALVVVTVTSPATLTHATSGATMTVNNFITNPAAGGAFDPAGPLTIGATLNVGTLQTAGSYSGNFVVTMTFQ